MAYKEVHRVEISEVIRRWQAGNSQRSTATGTGLSRETVRRHLAAAQEAGVAQEGPAATADQLSVLASVSRSGPREPEAPSEELLAPWSDQIYQWLTQDKLQFTRIQELLAERGCRISYSARHRWLSRHQWRRRSARTVRMEQSVSGEVAELDFGRLGFITDPARVRHPRDKPKVERGVQYARERFFKGGDFKDLSHLRNEAARWCRDVAGRRIHGTTRRQPLQVFLDEERQALNPWDGEPYEVTHWRTAKVHPDHHVAGQYALYSVPSTLCPPGQQVEIGLGLKLVRIYHRGRLVKGHPRQPRGGRATDAQDYPAELSAYTLRAPDGIKRSAAEPGPAVAEFAERLFDGPLPWAKVRQGHKLIRLGQRYTSERLDSACRRALEVDLIDVRRVERILLQALEQAEPPDHPPPLPAGRFARPGSVFAHAKGQRRQSTESTELKTGGQS